MCVGVRTSFSFQSVRCFPGISQGGFTQNINVYTLMIAISFPIDMRAVCQIWSCQGTSTYTVGRRGRKKAFQDNRSMSNEERQQRRRRLPKQTKLDSTRGNVNMLPEAGSTDTPPTLHRPPEPPESDGISNMVVGWVGCLDGASKTCGRVDRPL